MDKDSYLVFSSSAEDWWIRERFRQRFGEYPKEVKIHEIQEKWENPTQKWAGPVTKKHLKYEEEKKNE